METNDSKDMPILVGPDGYMLENTAIDTSNSHGGTMAHQATGTAAQALPLPANVQVEGQQQILVQTQVQNQPKLTPFVQPPPEVLAGNPTPMQLQQFAQATVNQKQVVASSPTKLVLQSPAAVFSTPSAQLQMQMMTSPGQGAMIAQQESPVQQLALLPGMVTGLSNVQMQQWQLQQLQQLQQLHNLQQAQLVQNVGNQQNVTHNQAAATMTNNELASAPSIPFTAPTGPILMGGAMLQAGMEGNSTNTGLTPHEVLPIIPKGVESFNLAKMAFDHPQQPAGPPQPVGRGLGGEFFNQATLEFGEKVASQNNLDDKDATLVRNMATKIALAIPQGIPGPTQAKQTKLGNDAFLIKDTGGATSGGPQPVPLATKAFFFFVMKNTKKSYFVCTDVVRIRQLESLKKKLLAKEFQPLNIRHLYNFMDLEAIPGWKSVSNQAKVEAWAKRGAEMLRQTFLLDVEAEMLKLKGKRELLNNDARNGSPLFNQAASARGLLNM